MQTTKRNRSLCFLAGILKVSILLSACVGGQVSKDNSGEYRNGMVVTAHPSASKVGLDILKRGVMQ